MTQGQKCWVKSKTRTNRAGNHFVFLKSSLIIRPHGFYLFDWESPSVNSWRLRRKKICNCRVHFINCGYMSVQNSDFKLTFSPNSVQNCEHLYTLFDCEWECKSLVNKRSHHRLQHITHQSGLENFSNCNYFLILFCSVIFELPHIHERSSSVEFFFFGWSPFLYRWLQFGAMTCCHLLGSFQYFLWKFWCFCVNVFRWNFESCFLEKKFCSDR